MKTAMIRPAIRPFQRVATQTDARLGRFFFIIEIPNTVPVTDRRKESKTSAPSMYFVWPDDAVPPVATTTNARRNATVARMAVIKENVSRNVRGFDLHSAIDDETQAGQRQSPAGRVKAQVVQIVEWQRLQR